MKPREYWLALLAGLVLMTPLSWLLGLLTPWKGQMERASTSPRLVPRLSGSKRSALMTYGRPCETDGECESPLACLASGSGNWCADSQCMTDADCSEGFTCQPRASSSGAAWVHVCNPVGIRKEGEQCERWPESKKESCEKGLLCRGWCARPCEPLAPHGCPEGFFCKQEPEGAACLPSCHGRTCPEGQACLKRGPEVSVCYQVEGTNCQEIPCPEGYRCRLHETGQPGLLRMGCEIICSPGGNECPEGMTCLISMCVQTCDPKIPDSSGPHSTCGQIFRDSPWLCRGKH